MTLFESDLFDDHEGVHFFSDPKSGLKAIIAIHNTNLGPGAGGTRLWSYANSKLAGEDALRLSRAMSYKNAMAGIPFGGGKGVIMRPSEAFNRADLFAAYGRAVETLGGRYYTAEDVGVGPQDMKVIHSQTKFVAGLDEGKSASGDPSPVTADGVFRGLHVAARHALGQNNLKDLRVAVQGLGHVGFNLCERLHAAGAKLWVADINNAVIDLAVNRFGAVSLAPDEIHMADVDIFAPCALSGAVNAKSIDQIKAKIIGGAANNQLASEEMGQGLLDRDILYCPDYVLNAGGIINVAAELSGTYDFEWVSGKLEDLKSTLKTIFEASKDRNIPTNLLADEMARARIYSA